MQISKEAMSLKRRRCLAIVHADPSIELDALIERLGVDQRSVLRWRAEARARRFSKHSAPRRRPRKLP